MWATAGTTRRGASRRSRRASALASRAGAAWAPPTEPCPGRPRAVTSSQHGVFSVNATPQRSGCPAAPGWMPPPSVSRYSAPPSRSRRSRVTRAAPCRPPASSSGVASRITSRSRGRSWRASATRVNRCTTVTPFASRAPRPTTKPPPTTPAKGSTVQTSGSAPTVSRWERSTTGRARPVPFTRAQRAARGLRSPSRRTTRVSIPSSCSRTCASQAASRPSSPGGLTVRRRMAPARISARRPSPIGQRRGILPAAPGLDGRSWLGGTGTGDEPDEDRHGEEIPRRPPARHRVAEASGRCFHGGSSSQRWF